MRGRVTGEQYAQIDNPDPFASPVWRSPVYRTPEPVIWLVQLTRLLARLAWFLIRHPLADTAAGALVLLWLKAGWPGLAALASIAVTSLALVRIWRPDWFTRWITSPIRCQWRWWFYRRHWHAVMTITGLAPLYRGRVMLPVLADVDAVGPGGGHQVGPVVEDQQRAVGRAHALQAAARGDDRLVVTVLDPQLHDVDAAAQRGGREGVGTRVADEVQAGGGEPPATIGHPPSLAGPPRWSVAPSASRNH